MKKSLRRLSSSAAVVLVATLASCSGAASTAVGREDGGQGSTDASRHEDAAGRGDGAQASTDASDRDHEANVEDGKVPSPLDGAAVDALAAPDAEAPDTPRDAEPQEIPPDCKNSGAIILGHLPAGSSEVNAIALDGPTIWVLLAAGSVEAIGLWSLPRLGGSPARRYQPESNAALGGFALDETYLYFTTGRPQDDLSNLIRVSRATGVADVLAKSVPPATEIAIDTSSIYWTTTAGPPGWAGAVSKMSKTGGSVTTLARGARPLGIAVDGPELFFTRGDTTASMGGIYRMPIDGGKETLLAEGGAFRLTQSATTVFAIASYSLRSVSKSTGTVTGLAITADLMGASYFAIDEGHLYFTTPGYWAGRPLPSAGKVQKVTLDGSPVAEIATCQGKPSSIAVDDRYVYWLNYITGEVVQAPK